MNARREGDENPILSAMAETVKLLANSSFGYQIMDRSRHTVSKYLSDGKTHGPINNKMFERLDFINDQMYEVELVKSKIQHEEPIIVAFFILRYTELRMLELYYNFFDKYCHVTKLKELEMEIDSLYLALSEHDLYEFIRPAMKKVWNSLRSGDCTDEF